MKCLLKCLLIGLSLTGGWAIGQQKQKPYAGWTVIITSTSVNKNEVLVIRAESTSPSMTFMFTCNADDSSCSAPVAVGEKCVVSVPQEGHYECDNRLLCGVPVCLKSAEAKAGR